MPSERCPAASSIYAPIPASSATLSSDLPSSIQPCGPRMRLSPDSGLTRDAFGAHSPALNWNAPRPAWLAIPARDVIPTRLPTVDASFPPPPATAQQTHTPPPPHP